MLAKGVGRQWLSVCCFQIERFDVALLRRSCHEELPSAVPAVPSS